MRGVPPAPHSRRGVGRRIAFPPSPTRKLGRQSGSGASRRHVRPASGFRWRPRCGAPAIERRVPPPAAGGVRAPRWPQWCEQRSVSCGLAFLPSCRRAPRSWPGRSGSRALRSSQRVLAEGGPLGGGHGRRAPASPQPRRSRRRRRPWDADGSGRRQWPALSRPRRRRRTHVGPRRHRSGLGAGGVAPEGEIAAKREKGTREWVGKREGV